MMLFLFDCVNTAVFVILARVFLELFLHPRQISRMLRVLITIAWILTEILIVNIFDKIFIAKALMTIGCTVMASIGLFSDSIIKKVVLSIIHYGFGASIEILVYLVAIRMTSYVQIYDVNDNLINVYGGVISAVVLIISLLVIRYVLKKEDPARLTGLEMVKFLAFPLASISMTVAFVYFNKGREVSEQEIWFFAFIAIIFLVSNVYMYWLLKTDVANKILKEKSLMAEAHARELSSLYEQIREEHKAIAGIEHEYKNHMTVISSLAASRKIDELNEYLSEMKESVTIVDVIDTGNAVCSALFNAKYAEAARKGIRVRFDISNLEGMRIKDEEMVIILSNLFNNAIEACEKCQSKKVIELKIDFSNEVLFIAFTNTCNEETVDRDKTSKHGKDESLMHGHGLSNIRRIVDSYGGQLDIIQNDRFTVRLIIPCGEEK